MRDGMNGAVNGAGAEIQIELRFIRSGRAHRGDQIIDAVAPAGADRHDADLEPLAQLFHIHMVPAAVDLIHHVQRDDHRLLQLHQLQ